MTLSAKNVVLGGVKSVMLHDTGNVEMKDLGSQVSVVIIHYHKNDRIINRHSSAVTIKTV